MEHWIHHILFDLPIFLSETHMTKQKTMWNNNKAINMWKILRILIETNRFIEWKKVNKFESVSKINSQMKNRSEESASKYSFEFNDDQETESLKFCIWSHLNTTLPNTLSLAFQRNNRTRCGPAFIHKD